MQSAAAHVSVLTTTGIVEVFHFITSLPEWRVAESAALDSACLNIAWLSLNVLARGRDRTQEACYADEGLFNQDLG
jgi:hypothetical protein